MAQLRAENAALQAENVTMGALVSELQRALQGAQEQIAALQASVAQLQAARDQAKGPPGFVKRNTPTAPEERPAGGHGQQRATRRATPGWKTRGRARR